MQKTLTRLMREGLSRHNAIHAIGSVLTGQMFDVVNDPAKSRDVNADYYRQLEELTAEGWLNSFREQ